MKKLLPFLLALLLASCQREADTRDPLPAASGQVRPVSVRIAGEDTKSLVSSSVEDFSCAYLFAFWSDSKNICTRQADGSTKPVAIYSEQKDFEWEIPVGSGRPLDIWTLVNPAEDIRALLDEYVSSGTALREDDLAALRFVCKDPEMLLALETDGSHMPMSGIEEGVTLSGTEASLTLTLKRLFSRYDIKLNTKKFTDDGWTVKAARIMGAQSNTEAPYFYTGSGTGYRQDDERKLALVDYATLEDLASLNTLDEDSRSEEYTTFYFLENCQGDLGPASNWSRVAQEIGEAQLRCCSYLDIAVEASKSGYSQRNFRYRLYLGQEQMRENFDIIRNRHQRISLLLDAPTDGFRWTAGAPVSVAPGEWVDIPFETTLKKEELLFECLKNNAPSDDLRLEKCRWNADGTGGTAVFQAAKDSEEGALVLLQGGDRVGDISDRIQVSITEEASFFKDVVPLHVAQYAAEWSCYDIRSYVEKYPGAFSATLVTFGSDGRFENDGRHAENIVPRPDSDDFGKDKTDIYRSHLFYDHRSGRLFVYGYPGRGNRHELTLSVHLGEDGDADDIDRSKTYVLRPKWPLFRTQAAIRGAYKVFTDYQTRLEMDSESFPSCEITGVLLDPDSHEVLTNSRFGWADITVGRYADRICFTGARWVGDNDPYVLNSAQLFESTNMYENERGEGFDACMTYKRGPRDKGIADFDRFELQMRDMDHAYDADTYISFDHSLFGGGNAFYPILKYHEKPPRKVVLLQAAPGTSRYEEMTASTEEAGEEFYLMKGLRQTFFINYQGFIPTEAPEITIEKGTEGLDFRIDRYPLKYKMERITLSLFRIDFEVDWTAEADIFDDTSVGYAPGMVQPVDFLSYRIRVSHPRAEFSDQIVAKVLHQRLGYTFSYDAYREPQSIEESNQLGGFLKMKMFNPFKFRFHLQWKATATLYLRHQISMLLGYKTDPDSGSSFSTNFSLRATPSPEGTLIEGSQPAQTINRACDKVWSSKAVKNVFKNEIVLNNHYFFYEHPLPKRLQLSISIGMPDGFDSELPGLSYAGECGEHTVMDRYCTAHFNGAGDLRLCYKYFLEREVWNDCLTYKEPRKENYETWKDNSWYLETAGRDRLIYYYAQVPDWFSWDFDKCRGDLLINNSEDYPRFSGEIGN